MQFPSITNLLLLSILTTACAADVATDGADNCGDTCDNLTEFPAINTQPESVLFIPMSSGYLGLSEKKWQSDDREFDRAIRELTEVYRDNGTDSIVTTPRLQRWEDLEATVAQFDGRTFDRVIILGHGALDGPITRGEANRTIDSGVIVEQWVMQPGLVREYTTSYSEDVFGDFIEENRDSLLAQYESVAEVLYEQLTEQDRADYVECVSNMAFNNEIECSVNCTDTCSTFNGQERNENCEEGCFFQCVDDFLNEVAQPTCSPLSIQFQERLDEDGFNSFAANLAKITANDGLIFLGYCNAATDAAGGTVVPVLSQLRSYTDLVASATGRHASGPIGKTSGQDIINRVTALEKDKDQKFLYIAAP